MDNNLYDALYKDKDRSDIILCLEPFFDKELKCYEIGAGTGLLSEKLYNKFEYYEAIEPDRSFFNQLKIRASEKFSAVNGYIDTDIKTAEFHLGLCIFNVINHIETENLDCFIGSCAKKLMGNGVFVFDCYNFDAVENFPPTKYSKKIKNGIIEILPSYSEGRLDLKYSQDSRKISTMSLYIHTPNSLETLLKKYFSIFEKNEIFGAQGDPYFLRYKCEK